MRRPLTLVGGIAVAAALTLGTVACSSDSKSSSSDTTAKSSTTIAAKNLVEIASGNADFSTLVGAVKTAGLVDTLSGKGPFTIFAPTNAAFAKLPAGTLASLTPEQLKSILTYHVVAGEVLAEDVKPGKVKTVNGAEFTVNVNNGKVSITDAKGNTVNVVSTDIVGSNGVIHVIDGVLLP
ncbi:MAG: fasciclin domain-containing protein [Acidimicrobiia bacterium]|nr:fasciclin domain-containing protein [Acidimicrobiia bacterium]